MGGDVTPGLKDAIPSPWRAAAWTFALAFLFGAALIFFAIHSLEVLGLARFRIFESIPDDPKSVAFFIRTAIFIAFLALALATVVTAVLLRKYQNGNAPAAGDPQRAHHDVLTGLPDRALFQDRLEQALRHARRGNSRIAVHLVDLDRFKEINDGLGHGVGDIILKTVAVRLAGCLRGTDTVARMSADEFGVIQSDLREIDGAAVLAQKLMAALAEPIRIDGQSLEMSSTTGITVFPDDAEDPQEVLRNADLALQHAKTEARGSYRFFVAAMNETIQRRRAVERDLKLALERNEFLLYYQPKLNIKTGRITGMEALIRWRHPEQGFLSPAEFIPIAERSRLIVPIGTWALNEACSFAKRLRDADLPQVKVAVNLSAVQFREKELVDVVRQSLEQSRLDPALLELEITETVAMTHADETISVFRRLADLGLSLSIDDFGTGYSSLSYLKNFPVHRIKIDKAFVDDIGTDQNPGAIARAVTTLAHSFAMEVTAEGVENEGQLAFLDGIGCDEIQGYYFSKPLPEEGFKVFLDNFDQTQPVIAAVAKRAGIRAGD